MVLPDGDDVGGRNQSESHQSEEAGLQRLPMDVYHPHPHCRLLVYLHLKTIHNKSIILNQQIHSFPDDQIHFYILMDNYTFFLIHIRLTMEQKGHTTCFKFKFVIDFINSSTPVRKVHVSLTTEYPGLEELLTVDKLTFSVTESSTLPTPDTNMVAVGGCRLQTQRSYTVTFIEPSDTGTTYNKIKKSLTSTTQLCKTKNIFIVSAHINHSVHSFQK